MRKIAFNFFMILIIGIFCCSCNSAATEKINETGNHNRNQGIAVSGHLHLVDFPNDNRIQAIEYTFPNGTKMFTSSGDAKPIFLINGTYDLNIESSIVDDVFMVSIKDLCDSLNINTTAENDKITIANDGLKIIFKANDDTALINDKKSTLEAAPKMIKDKIYLPLSFICGELNLDADYFDPSEKYCLFAWNTIITIDQKSNLPGLSEEEAYDYLKENLDTAYSHFEDNFKKLYHPDSNTLLSNSAILKKDIDNLKLVGSISEYYIFKGLFYTIFVDKYNKDVYFHIPTISTLNTKKINFDDEELFEYNYMVD